MSLATVPVNEGDWTAEGGRIITAGLSA
jgi:hypothetical protein